MPNPIAKSKNTPITASAAETTIVPADPNFSTQLNGLVITSISAAAATLTLRESTGGVIRAVFDYPNAAVAPGAPLVVMFNPPLQQSLLNNQNWTIQASAANTYNVNALFNEA
jgi:hypothetical protein